MRRVNLASIILFIFTMNSCSVNRDVRNETETNRIRLSKLDLTLYKHFKNGNYVISIDEKIGNTLTKPLVNLQDSTILKNDTIDLQLTDIYWTRRPIKRVLRSCIEMDGVRIYSISESKYIYKIKRTVSKSKNKDIHSRYTYINIENGDTILQSYSFEIGTPPF